MIISKGAAHDAGLLFLRLATGTLMLLHGIGKLSDWLNGQTGFFDPFGIGGRTSLSLVVVAEFFCSTLVIVGFQTRLALVPLIISMSVAFFLFHAHDELMDKELPLIYLLNFTALMLTGPGRYSVDGWRFQKDKIQGHKEPQSTQSML